MQTFDEINIIICGVGGQGVILMSEMIGGTAIRDGVHVRGSEVHGMAARGGSVSSHIRLGEKVLGPVSPLGKCDILIGMEPVEALRNINYLAPSGLVLINTQIIYPFTVSLGINQYPSLDKIISELDAAASSVVALNALQIAEESGSSLSANTVMLGALLGTQKLPLSPDSMKAEIERRFGAKSSGVNLKAFALGYQASHQKLEASH